jgi:hypothetical protein
MSERIVKMPRAFVAQDGSIVELDFETETGEHRVLQFPMDAFEQFMGRAAQLVLGIQSRKPTIPGHLSIHALEAVAIGAEAPVGGGKVHLILRGSTGLPMAIAISPEAAEQLRPQLYRAAKSAKKEGEKSRH